MRNKKRIRNAAKKGASGVTGILLLIAKILATVLLIIVTTGVIFACIFTVYIKTNLTTQMDVTLESFKMNLTSAIYYTDPDTGADVQMVELQSTEFRTWVDYKDIPQDLIKAVISIEDQRFYSHHGVDWYRTAGAFVNMFLGMKNTFGGSTITQQLIKNLLEQNEVTVQRKLLEIFRALELEKKYEKEDILEWYLNYVYFGHGRYGIAAASNYYFDKDVSELTLAEMAAIVGITNNPSMYSPYVSAERNKERQEIILAKMLEQGYISQAEFNRAKAQTLTFKRGSSGKDVSVTYTWFEEAVITDAQKQIAEESGVSLKVANTLLFSGGYKIYATMDPKIQAIVDAYYENTENFATKNTYLQSGIVITNPYTGDIVALSGGVGEKVGNRILSRATSTKRSPGSSIKPLASYSLAMDLGLITPDTLIEDSKDVTLNGTTWMAKNDSRTYTEGGIVTIRDALRRSLNTVAAQLVDMLTPEVSYRFMTEELGFTSLVPDDAAYAPMALGQLTNGVTVREMAQGYSIFPTLGIYRSTRTYTHISDQDGNIVYTNEPETHTAIKESTAYWMTSMLTDAVASGTGTAARIKGMPTAGKTGTSGSSKDRWFCGFTPYYLAAVWVGYDIPAKISWSGNPAAQIFKTLMTEIHADLEAKNFTKPADIRLEPVPGVETIDYTVRGVDAEGNLLYEQVGSGIVGRDVEVTAQPLEGYILLSPETATILLTEMSSVNTAEFRYMPEEPEVTDDPTVTDDPQVSDDPGTLPTPGPDDPAPKPSPTPTLGPDDPPPSPTPTPGPDDPAPKPSPSTPPDEAGGE